MLFFVREAALSRYILASARSISAFIGQTAAQPGERVPQGNLFSLFQPGLIGRHFLAEMVDCGCAFGSLSIPGFI
jgi:hypothetical protein